MLCRSPFKIIVVLSAQNCCARWSPSELQRIPSRPLDASLFDKRLSKPWIEIRKNRGKIGHPYRTEREILKEAVTCPLIKRAEEAFVVMARKKLTKNSPKPTLINIFSMKIHSTLSNALITSSFKQIRQGHSLTHHFICKNPRLELTLTHSSTLNYHCPWRKTWWIQVTRISKTCS